MVFNFLSFYCCLMSSFMFFLLTFLYLSPLLTFHWVSLLMGFFLIGIWLFYGFCDACVHSWCLAHVIFLWSSGFSILCSSVTFWCFFCCWQSFCCSGGTYGCFGGSGCFVPTCCSSGYSGGPGCSVCHLRGCGFSTSITSWQSSGSWQSFGCTWSSGFSPSLCLDGVLILDRVLLFWDLFYFSGWSSWTMVVGRN